MQLSVAARRSPTHQCYDGGTGLKTLTVTGRAELTDSTLFATRFPA